MLLYNLSSRLLFSPAIKANVSYNKQKNNFVVSKTEYEQFYMTNSWLTLIVVACTFAVTDDLETHADRLSVVTWPVGNLHNYHYLLPAIVSNMT